MYSVAGYGRMLSDHVRVRAYTEAMKRAITPGCTVLDIGTGTGFFAMLACRLGAGKVYAIEFDEVIQLARMAASDNAYADRIVFLQDLSTKIELPEQVDVIVSDLRTVIPWFEQHIPTISDARTRFLKPGGVLIPQSDELWAAVIEMPLFYAEHVGHQPQDTAGFDMSAARRLGANNWAKAQATPDQMLTTPRQWARLDYCRVNEANVAAEISWTADRSGTGHGFIAWFDTDLLGGIGFSNAPGNDRLIYGQAFFPWPEPVPISAGDEISVSLRGDLAANDYFWRWATVVKQSGSKGKLRAQFAQNSLPALNTFASVRSRGPDHVPVPSDRLEVDRFVLSCIDGQQSFRQIAEEVAARFPETFPTWEAALAVVTELFSRYVR